MARVRLAAKAKAPAARVRADVKGPTEDKNKKQQSTLDAVLEPWRKVGRVLSTQANRTGQALTRTYGNVDQAVSGSTDYAGRKMRAMVTGKGNPTYEQPAPRVRMANPNMNLPTARAQQWTPYGASALNPTYTFPSYKPSPTVMPDTLQGQADRVYEQLFTPGSILGDRRMGGAIGDGADDYNPAQVYARAPRVTAPRNNYGGYASGWGDWGDGGGGGGGYTERPPEWYERMVKWSY